MKSNKHQERRKFLRRAGAAAMASPMAAALTMPVSAYAKSDGTGQVPLIDGNPPSPSQGLVAAMNPNTTRRLRLINEHTGDDVDVVYYTNGFYLNHNVAQLNRLMRDRRANAATQMDLTLYDQLYLLSEAVDIDEPLHVLSGYRTAKTNAMLRSRSKGVAKFSLHMEGRAADIYIPGYSSKKLQADAIDLQAGGVGVYSRSNFVHVDTGTVRYWGS